MIPPVDPEIIVHIMILGELFDLGLNISMVEPPLKNSQLTNRSMVPNTTNGKELISNKSSFCNSPIHHSTSAGLC